MTITPLKTIGRWALAALFLVALTAQAEAAKKVVLQISDADPSKQTLVLNVANNLLKAYGQDNVEVEIVAFGPGLRLMFKDNQNAGRISGLASSDVRFFGCSNTLNKFTKKLGYKPELHADIVSKGPGVVRIMELIEQGYTLVKP